jgi:ferritin-like metal-binding protein YciE
LKSPGVKEELSKITGTPLKDAVGMSLEELVNKLPAKRTPEQQTMLRKLYGMRLLKARRVLDDALEGIKPGEGLTSDEQALLEMRKSINNMVKNELNAGANNTINQADGMFRDFKGSAEEYLNSLKKRGSDEVSTRKVVKSLKDAGGDAERAEREAFKKQFDAFVEKYKIEFNDADKQAIQEAQDAWNKSQGPLKDAQGLTRLKSETGVTTGRSLMSIGTSIGAGIAGGPLAGVATQAIAAPIMNPAVYLQLLALARQAGDTKTVKALHEAAKRASQAAARQAGQTED